MNYCEMTYFISYALGQPRTVSMNARHEKHGCQMNFMGRFSEELPLRVVQQFISEDDP